MKEIQNLVTPCTTSSTSSSTTTSTTTTTTISSTSSPLHEDYYGSFQWTLDAGSGYVETASGSFSFSINPSTYAISGSGTGFVTDKLGSPSPCSASGSGGYSFAVSGTYATFNNNLSVQFGNANPQTVTAQETCPGPPTIVETATWYTGAGVLPSNAMITAADGATVSCPPTCFGSQVTYQITIHSGQQTSTESTTQTTSTIETRLHIYINFYVFGNYVLDIDKFLQLYQPNNQYVQFDKHCALVRFSDGQSRFRHKTRCNHLFHNRSCQRIFTRPI